MPLMVAPPLPITIPTTSFGRLRRRTNTAESSRFSRAALFEQDTEGGWVGGT